jgi:MraZ protein
MFLGEFQHAIDEKGRLTIPAKYRGLLANGMVVTRGFDRNLMAFTMTGWEELAERIKGLSLTDPHSREFRRRVFSGAVDLTPDKQGRILLPPYLREFAEIETDAIIAGMHNYMEIWSADRWNPVRETIEGDSIHWENLGI